MSKVLGGQILGPISRAAAQSLEPGVQEHHVVEGEQTTCHLIFDP